MSADCFTVICEETEKDPIMYHLRARVLAGWPNERPNCPSDLLEYWNQRDELSVIDRLAFKASCVVIPTKLISLMLSKIHTGHLVEKCKSHARELLYRPGLNKDIEDLVRNCTACSTIRSKQCAVCRLEFNKQNYIVVVDYYSNYPEVILINSQTSSSVIKTLKSTFARHGIPNQLVSDNGPCYASAEFEKFSQDWGFKHHIKPQISTCRKNWQTIKTILKQCKLSGEDPLLDLLSYRSTPLPHSLSPPQLLMGWRIQTNLPATTKALKPKTPPRDILQQKEFPKEKQKTFYDRRARPVELPHLDAGTTVRLQDYKTGNYKMKSSRK